MLRYLRKSMRDARDRGASAVEYGLMVAAIAALIVTVVFALGGVVKNVFSGSCRAVSVAQVPAAGATAAPGAPTACQ